MTQSPEDPPSWLLWLISLVPVVVALGAFMKRFFATVTRAELREYVRDIQESNNRIIDQRHEENLGRLANQDKDLKEIRVTVNRIEGQLSGRYPRVKDP